MRGIVADVITNAVVAIVEIGAAVEVQVGIDIATGADILEAARAITGDDPIQYISMVY